MNTTTTSCLIPRPICGTAKRRRFGRSGSGALGLGFLAVTCLATAAQMFTRVSNELRFQQSDAGVAVWFDYDNDGWADVFCAGG